MFKNGDRVKETTITTGTGTIVLLGAATNFVTFSVGVGSGNKCFYSIVDDANSAWETGIGEVTGASLSRDTVLSSSTGGGKVSFAVGDKVVFCPALRIPFLNEYQDMADANLTVDETNHGQTIVNDTNTVSRDIIIGTAPIRGVEFTAYVTVAQQVRILVGAGASLRRGQFAALTSGQGIQVSGIGAIATIKKVDSTTWAAKYDPYGGWATF